MKHYFLAAALMAAAMSPVYAAQHATPDRMQERNLQMDTMMDQAHKASTPAERQTLMGEHMKAMQEQMAAMHDMMGPNGSMGRQGPGGAMTNSDMAPQMQMMRQRMDMMQEMMKHMLHQQDLMMAPNR